MGLPCVKTEENPQDHRGANMPKNQGRGLGKLATLIDD